MSLIATNKAGTFQPLPEGTHMARCIGAYDLGHQETKFGVQHKVVLNFEFPEFLVEYDGKEQPMTTSKIYTMSTNEKATLRKHLESWRGKAFSDEEIEAFDLRKLLTKTCMITITHETKEEKTYSNIASITAMHRSMQCPPTWNDSVYYEIEMGTADTFGHLPEWVQKKAKLSQELAAPAPALAPAPASAPAAALAPLGGYATATASTTVPATVPSAPAPPDDDLPF